jgi:hypothetical protein
MRISWAGLCVAALSGMLLFLADGQRYYYSITFRLKLTSVVLGVLLACALRGRMLTASALIPETSQMGAVARIIAAASLLCWLSAIMAGRLMAYMS